MKSESPLIEITPELAAVIGQPNPGTRFYHAEGSAGAAYRAWWDVLVQHCPGGLVSPGGASRYAGVSRAAIHKAMKEGRITAFAFHEVKKVKGVFSKVKSQRSSPFVYLPVAELKAWNKVLREQVERLKAGKSGETPEQVIARLKVELEGKDPDWIGRFYDRFPDKEEIKHK